MPKSFDLEEEKRNELGKKMVEDLMIIAELEQRPIKHFKANKNGIFYEVHVDYKDHYSSTK
ncbi:hypothetical protein GJV03_19690 [Acinetobacter sp. RIT698]|uniref:hypothetical protein n=1 Tax=Acinetobacter sp. RIT698 TaxID=2666192 RepID=UPI0012AC93A7|nr:hypothetical protein [Acinetobacter sp. RIT698]MRT39384.1 hypothetical protein [Acinetobacter sp. RIT698]